MRKILLATTALAGVALFAGSAQAGMEVTVGGYNDFRAGFFKNDLNTNPDRSADFQNEFQLEVEAKAKANNGIEYGVVASLWNGGDYTTAPAIGATDSTGSKATAIRTRQAFGYVNGAWGQVRLGDEHGASDFAVHAPATYGFGGQVDGSYVNFLSPATIAVLTPGFINDDENDTKVTYLTPKFGMNGHKFQAGVSYAPNNNDGGTNVTVSQNPGGVTAGNPLMSTNYKNVIEVGAGYEGTWMDKFSAKAGVVVTTADNVDNMTFNGDPVHDYTTWDLGGQVGYAGFTVGGNYTDGGRYNTTALQTRDQHVWSVGASYKFDRASIAGSYLSGEGYNNMFGTATATSASNYADHYRAWGIGAGYSLFDGMVTSVDAVFFKQDGPTGGVTDTDGHVVILSNRISF